MSRKVVVSLLGRSLAVLVLAVAIACGSASSADAPSKLHIGVHAAFVVSGGGSGSLAEAIEAGLDAFMTGEPTERVMAEAREAGIHFIAAGHYATETFGVRRLGELIAERFGVQHTFVDLPNPI
jgi:putative NIF3 family GTP cyclohydrolase 1 type 2